MTDRHDVIVVGGGQAGLAVGYYLKQQGRDFVILEAAFVLGSQGFHDVLPSRRQPAGAASWKIPHTRPITASHTSPECRAAVKT